MISAKIGNACFGCNTLNQGYSLGHSAVEGGKCISVKLVEYKNISEFQEDRERIILLFLWKADYLLKILKCGLWDKFLAQKN